MYKLTEMLQILLIFTIILHSALSTEKVELTKISNSKYLRSNIEKSFKEALLECYSRNLQLLSIEDDYEMQYLEDLLITKKDYNPFWTSGTDLHAESHLVWAANGKLVDIPINDPDSFVQEEDDEESDEEDDYEDYDFEDYGVDYDSGEDDEEYLDETDAVGMGRCILMDFDDDDDTLQLYLEVCEKKSLFICEELDNCGLEAFAGKSEIQNPKENVIENNLQLNHGTLVKHRNVTYFVSNDGFKLMWNEAYAYCIKMNMQLHSVETQLKSELMNKLSSNVSYWTSGTDMGDHGNWIWITTGEEIGNAEASPNGYYEFPALSWTMWKTGNPNLDYGESENDDQHCLSISKEHFWEDEWCFMKNSFICEPSTKCE